MNTESDVEAYTTGDDCLKLVDEGTDADAWIRGKSVDLGEYQ